MHELFCTDCAQFSGFFQKNHLILIAHHRQSHFPESVQYGVKRCLIMTLVTCDTRNGNKRIVVLAKLIESVNFLKN